MSWVFKETAVPDLNSGRPGLQCRFRIHAHQDTVGGQNPTTGCGTLALPTAQQSLSSYINRVHIIDLGSLTDGALIPAALAATLGLDSGAQDPMRQIAAFLKHKRLLILLDNCEHVVHDAAAVAEQLLSVANVPLAFTRMRLVSSARDSDSEKKAA